MKRKLSLLLLCILLTFSLSGCVIDDAFDMYKDKVDEQDANAEQQKRFNLLNNVSFNSRSKETDDAMNAYTSVQAKANNASGWRTWWPATHIPGVGAKALQAQADRNYLNFKLAAQADEVYQDSLVNGPGDKTSTFDKLKSSGIFSIILVVLLIVILLGAILLLLGMRNQKKIAKVQAKAARKAKVPVPSVEDFTQPLLPTTPAPAPSNIVDMRQYQKTAISDEAYLRMIQENCKRLGMDANALINSCGGNLEQAYQQSNLQIAMRS